MNKAQFKQFMLRHSLLWGCAIIAPTLVMVVLDGFDKHTPNNIALFSSLTILFIFIFSNALVAKTFQSTLIDENENQDPSSAS